MQPLGETPRPLVGAPLPGGGLHRRGKWLACATAAPCRRSLPTLDLASPQEQALNMPPERGCARHRNPCISCPPASLARARPLLCNAQPGLRRVHRPHLQARACRRHAADAQQAHLCPLLRPWCPPASLRHTTHRREVPLYEAPDYNLMDYCTDEESGDPRGGCSPENQLKVGA